MNLYCFKFLYLSIIYGWFKDEKPLQNERLNF